MFSIYFLQLYGNNGDEIGAVSKQWSGLVKEIFTDAENFGIKCKYSMLTRFVNLHLL